MNRLVRDLMRPDFIRISPAESVLSVMQLMSMARVRALPVVEEGRVRGLVAHRDLASAVLGLTGRAIDAAARVERFVQPVAPVSPEAPLPEAARRMVAESIPCLVAALGDEEHGQEVVGLLTEGDLLREAYRASRASRASGANEASIRSGSPAAG